MARSGLRPVSPASEASPSRKAPDDLPERLAKALLPPLESRLERLELLVQEPPDLTHAVQRITATVCSVMDERRLRVE